MDDYRIEWILLTVSSTEINMMTFLQLIIRILEQEINTDFTQGLIHLPVARWKERTRIYNYVQGW